MVSFRTIVLLMAVLAVKKINASEKPPQQLSDEELRAQGCLFGLAVGDAYASKNPGAVLPGEISHSTHFSLSLAWSLIRERGFNSENVARSYVALYQADPKVAEGKMREGLEKGDLDKPNNKDLLTNNANRQSLGHGFLMRLAPMGIAAIGWSDAELYENVGLDCALTHNSAEAQDAARAFVAAIRAGILTGRVDEMFAAAKKQAQTKVVQDALTRSDRVEPIMDEKLILGTFSGGNQGYFAVAFENAFLSLRSGMSFEQAVKRTILRGGKTAVNCAVLGALYGACFGVEKVPDNWRYAVAHTPNNLLPTSNTMLLTKVVQNLMHIGNYRAQRRVQQQPVKLDKVIAAAIDARADAVGRLSFEAAMVRKYAGWDKTKARPGTHVWHILDRSDPQGVTQHVITNPFSQTELTAILTDPVASSRAVYNVRVKLNTHLYEASVSDRPVNWMAQPALRNSMFGDDSYTYLLQTRASDSFLQRVLRLQFNGAGALVVERWNGEAKDANDLWSTVVPPGQPDWVAMDAGPFKLALDFPTTRIPLKVQLASGTIGIEQFRVTLGSIPPSHGCDIQGWAEQVSAVKSRDARPMRFELCYAPGKVAPSPPQHHSTAGPVRKLGPQKWSFTPTTSTYDQAALLTGVTTVMENLAKPNPPFQAEKPDEPPIYFLHGSPTDPTTWGAIAKNPSAPQLWTTAWQHQSKNIDTYWAASYQAKLGQPGFLSIWRRDPSVKCTVQAWGFKATLHPKTGDSDKVHARTGYFHHHDKDTYDAYVFPTSAAVQRCALQLYQTIQLLDKTGPAAAIVWDAAETASQPLADPDAASSKWTPCDGKTIKLSGGMWQEMDAKSANCQQEWYRTLVIKAGDDMPKMLQSSAGAQPFQRIAVSDNPGKAIEKWWHIHGQFAHDDTDEIRVIHMYPEYLNPALKVVKNRWGDGYQIVSANAASAPDTSFTIDLNVEAKRHIQCMGKQKTEPALDWLAISTDDVKIMLGLKHAPDDYVDPGAGLRAGGRAARFAAAAPSP